MRLSRIILFCIAAMLASGVSAQRYIVVRPQITKQITPAPKPKPKAKTVRRGGNSGSKRNVEAQEETQADVTLPEYTWPMKVNGTFDGGTFEVYIDKDYNWLHGSVTWNGGARYEGTFRDGQLEKGKLTAADGASFAIMIATATPLPMEPGIN